MKKAITAMNEKELLEVIQKDLKVNGVDSFETLIHEISHGTLSDNLTAVGARAYAKLLKKELSKNARHFWFKADTSNDMGDYLSALYADLDHEEVHVISVDNASHIIADNMISSGTVTKSIASPADALRKVIENNATGFFICHNHPSGNLQPSDADFTFTNNLQFVAKYLKINMLDHFIVGDGRFLSMAAEGLL